MNDHHSPVVHVLRVPGARIHAEVRGSGPLLLMIPGGPQDAGVLADLAQRLAEEHTTVAYDPRGNSRSVLNDVGEEQRLEVHAGDAARLIEELGNGRAHVFGTSGGAQIALALAAHRPDLVDTVVAHEPPCALLLEDPSEVLAHDRLVYDTYREKGVEAAMALFFGLNELDEDEGPPENEGDAATFARVAGNFDHFLGHGLLPLSLYRPDTELLRRTGTRLVVGLGEGSVGRDVHAMGSALARELEVEPVAFPGDHLGFEVEPAAFTATLRAALGGRG